MLRTCFKNTNGIKILYTVVKYVNLFCDREDEIISTSKEKRAYCHFSTSHWTNLGNNVSNDLRQTICNY